MNLFGRHGAIALHEADRDAELSALQREIDAEMREWWWWLAI